MSVELLVFFGAQIAFYVAMFVLLKHSNIKSNYFVYHLSPFYDSLSNEERQAQINMLRRLNRVINVCWVVIVASVVITLISIVWALMSASVH